MAKTYIAKALSRLSVRPDGPDACDKIARRLTDMLPAQVNQLDDDLNFGWLRWQTRNTFLSGETPEEAADTRRAAQLVARVLLPTSRADLATAQSWDGSDARSVLDKAQTAVVPARTGYYLKGSFWAFSDHAERVWIKASWEEAVALIQDGVRVARWAAHDAASANLVRRWFGASAPGDVKAKLELLQAAMATHLVGICYLGNGLSQNRRYKETGPDVHATQLQVKQNSTEWGFASPQASTHNNIGFGARFFLSGDTAIRLARPHDFQTPLLMEVTRGGAIVHELTHRYLHTNDEDLPNAVYTFLNKPAPTGARAKGYGPRACRALAATRPDLALTNADSFRVFCEDASLTGP